MIAFWSYDLFPFVLSGTVEKEDKKTDLVRITEYQSWFKPICVLPDEEGRQLQEKLAQVSYDHDRVLQHFRVSFKARVLEIAPFMQGRI
jgi:hypothetical protein